MRERAIESYYKQQVAAAGGFTRKLLGRINDPDQLTIWPRYRKSRRDPLGLRAAYSADIHFVEIKAPGERPRPGQLREHSRLQCLGCTVVVLDTKALVDAYVKAWRS